MRRHQAAWLGLLISGSVLVLMDLLSQVLIRINGVPAVGVLGGALILLALTSMMNWLSKEAWEQRNRPSGEQEV